MSYYYYHNDGASPSFDCGLEEETPIASWHPKNFMNIMDAKEEDVRSAWVFSDDDEDEDEKEDDADVDEEEEEKQEDKWFRRYVEACRLMPVVEESVLQRTCSRHPAIEKFCEMDMEDLSDGRATKRVELSVVSLPHYPYAPRVSYRMHKLAAILAVLNCEFHVPRMGAMVRIGYQSKNCLIPLARFSYAFLHGKERELVEELGLEVPPEDAKMCHTSVVRKFMKKHRKVEHKGGDKGGDDGDEGEKEEEEEEEEDADDDEGGDEGDDDDDDEELQAKRRKNVVAALCPDLETGEFVPFVYILADICGSSMVPKKEKEKMEEEMKEKKTKMLTDLDSNKMTVDQLKLELRKRSLSTSGRKAELQQRLNDALGHDQKKKKKQTTTKAKKQTKSEFMYPFMDKVNALFGTPDQIRSSYRFQTAENWGWAPGFFNASFSWFKHAAISTLYYPSRKQILVLKATEEEMCW